ncbi:hypothetical protein PL78_00985 [Yersinia entomophaga]|uniref:DUF1795 domain-containing protein n=1 Tax=Yersinia entomophaga TaxID=935293 RepID=A0ABM6BG50_YERET|nr:MULTISPECIES: DUF1795 domain-containing protein [Yersinia]ANI28417.1 hypothetical protein PL78_00985 [Yersinia entomophaga]OWF85059.1 hypothetical protein B4914_18045 [Yersinia entomophaga]
MTHPAYLINEGTLAIPANWRDETMNVFIAPDDSGINLVVSRMAVPVGLDNESYYAQVIEQFQTSLPGYKERSLTTVTLSEQPARLLEYFWKSPEGEMHQSVVMQVRGTKLLTFTITSPKVLAESQKTALLAIIYSYQAA